MPRILFVTRKSANCGVSDYGGRLFNILKKHLDITLFEAEDANIDYSGHDVALYNYHVLTLPFVRTDNRSIRHVALFHEDSIHTNFDAVIPIPTLPRPIFEIDVAPLPPRARPLIGSFGFGFPDKNFAGMAQMVREQFSQALLRLHIPYSSFMDSDGHQARQRVREVEAVLRGSNIELEVTHEYRDTSALLSWLAEHDLNLFLHAPSRGRGLSSSTDYALSVKRPIGISSSEMFRHLPRHICVDNVRLPQLIEGGFDSLKDCYRRNSNVNLVLAIADRLLKVV